MLYFIYDSKTLVLGKTVLQSSKRWSWMLYIGLAFFFIEFAEKSVGHCKGKGTDIVISLLPAERILWGH